MEPNKNLTTTLTDDIYSRKKTFLWISIGVGIILLIIGFLANFPLNKILSNTISNQITNIKQCPISYESMDLSFLMPKIKLTDVTIDGRCFQQPGKIIKLKNIDVHFTGPSFYPPGVKLYAQITEGNTNLNLYQSLSFHTKILKITNSQVDAAIMKPLMDGQERVQGLFSIDALVSLEGQNVKEADILIKSRDISLPSQEYMGFNLKKLDLGDFSLKASLKNEQIDVDSIVLGNESSPVVLQLNGKINKHKFQFPRSSLDLKGEVKFTQKFLQDFSILNLFLSGKNKRNGFYQLRLKGTIERPEPKIL